MLDNLSLEDLEGMLDGLYPVEPERLRPLLDETIVMARLLDDLRTLSMAEAGVLPLHREAVDPREVADDTVQVFQPMAAEAGVTLEARHAADAPGQLVADPALPVPADRGMLTMFAAGLSSPEYGYNGCWKVETISTRGSVEKIFSVPLPWWTSKSITATRSMACAASACAAPTATLLRRQKPIARLRSA